MIDYQITKPDIAPKDLDVYFWGDADQITFWGTVEIYANGERKDITGEHGLNDYEEEYGFVIVP